MRLSASGPFLAVDLGHARKREVASFLTGASFGRQLLSDCLLVRQLLGEGVLDLPQITKAPLSCPDIFTRARREAILPIIRM